MDSQKTLLELPQRTSEGFLDWARGGYFGALTFRNSYWGLLQELFLRILTETLSGCSSRNCFWRSLQKFHLEISPRSSRFLQIPTESLSGNSFRNSWRFLHEYLVWISPDSFWVFFQGINFSFRRNFWRNPRWIRWTNPKRILWKNDGRRESMKSSKKKTPDGIWENLLNESQEELLRGSWRNSWWNLHRKFWKNFRRKESWKNSVGTDWRKPLSNSWRNFRSSV